MNAQDTRPILAITVGDPAGIGPEIILKALRHADVYERCRPLVVGDRRMLERAVPWVEAEGLAVEIVESPAEGSYKAGVVTVLDLADADPADVPIGIETAGGGAAAVSAVFRACDLAMAGEVDAVVTAPLNKAAMHMAGFTYPGHTELLAERTGAGKITMLADRSESAGGACFDACWAGGGDPAGNDREGAGDDSVGQRRRAECSGCGIAEDCGGGVESACR